MERRERTYCQGKGSQIRLLEMARAAQSKAQIDNELVERDYQQQVEKYVAYYKREPTNEELVDAHLADFKDALDSFDESKKEQDEADMAKTLENINLKEDIDMLDVDENEALRSS